MKMVIWETNNNENSNDSDIKEFHQEKAELKQLWKNYLRDWSNQDLRLTSIIEEEIMSKIKKQVQERKS